MIVKRLGTFERQGSVEGLTIEDARKLGESLTRPDWEGYAPVLGLFAPGAELPTSIYALGLEFRLDVQAELTLGERIKCC